MKLYELGLHLLIKVLLVLLSPGAIAASRSGGTAESPIPHLAKIIEYISWVAGLLLFAFAVWGIKIAYQGLMSLMNQASNQGMHAPDSNTNPWLQVLSGALIASASSVIAVWLYTFDLDVAGIMNETWSAP